MGDEMTKIKMAARGGRLLCAVAVGMALSQTVLAQSAPVAAGGIEEIVVTAQKRSESLQSVPVSVTALTPAALAELKLDSPSDLVTQIPNLQVNGIVGEAAFSVGLAQALMAWGLSSNVASILATALVVGIIT